MATVWKKLFRTEHRWTWRNLSAYMDGELTPTEADRAEDHLRVCGICQQELDGLCRLTSLLRRVPSKPIPRSFCIREETAADRGHARVRTWAYTATRTATVLATLLLVFVLGGDLLFYGGMGMLPRSARPAILSAPHELVTVEEVEQAVDEEKVTAAQAEAVLEKQAAATDVVESSGTPSVMAIRAPQEEGTFTQPEAAAAPVEAAQEEPRAGGGTVSAQSIEGATPAPDATPEKLARALPTEPAAKLPEAAAIRSQTELSARRLRYIEFALLGVTAVLICATLILRRGARRR